MVHLHMAVERFCNECAVQFRIIIVHLGPWRQYCTIDGCVVDFQANGVIKIK